MSENITVSCRRSAAGLDSGGGAGGSATSSATGVDASAEANARVRAGSTAPQSPQNLLPGGFSASHAAQRTSSGAPQSPQNFFPSGLALPQFGQSSRTSADHLFGARDHLLRYCYPELSSGNEIDGYEKLRAKDRQFTRLGAVENPVNVLGGSPVNCRLICRQ